MKTVPLGEVATIERKGVDPRTLPAETLYLGLEHIERGGRVLGYDTVAGADLASTKFLFDSDHVLFGKLRPNLGKISRPSFGGVCSTDILPIRPGGELDRDYLAHYLSQPTMVEFAASRAAGANLPRLSPSVLASFPIPLPPLDEQRRIATILDKADSIRTKRREALAHLDALSRSAYREITTRGETDRVSLREMGVDFTTGKNVVGDDRNSHPTNRVIKVSAMSSGEFLPDESKPMPYDYDPPANHQIARGDILFGRASGSLDLLGATAIVEDDVHGLYLPDKVWRLMVADTARVDPLFVYGILRSRATRAFIRHHASGAAGVRDIRKAERRSRNQAAVDADETCCRRKVTRRAVVGGPRCPRGGRFAAARGARA